MATHMDPKMLNGFAHEVQPTLSKMREGIAAFLRKPTHQEALEDAYECIQTVQDAAAMMELPMLGQLIALLAEMVEDIAAAGPALQAQQGTWAQHAAAHLEAYLQQSFTPDAQDVAPAVALVQAYRRFKQLPAAGDQAAVTALLGQDVVVPAVVPASPVPTAAPASEAMDEADELIEGFLMEAEDYLNAIGRTLPEVEKAADQRACLQNVRRHIHTFKGAAGVVGFRTASQLAHRMEDLLDELYAESRPYTPHIHTVLFATFDALDEFVRSKGNMPTFDHVAAQLQQVYNTVWDPNAAALPVPAVAVAAVPEVAPAPVLEAVPAVVEAQDSTVPSLTQLADVLRVPVARVDDMVRLVSELVISRSTYEQHLGRLMHQVDELRLSIERLQRTSTTVETQYEVQALDGGMNLRHPKAAEPRSSGRALTSGPSAQEFDALEFDRYSEFTLVARELTETTADINALGQEFKDVVSDFEGYLTRQSRLTSEIQDKLMRLRMVPLATLATRLHRAVRVTAQQRGKEAVLVLEGEDVEFDKTMLEDMADPLLHLLRNAVDHGLEAPDARVQAGKARQGTVHLRAFREGTQVVLQMRDDGAGLNVQRLRATAVQNGLYSEADAAALTDEELHALIFKPGFSTASSISEVSGRGVGMDVVYTNISRMKGQISIQSTPGQGVTFTVRLPLTMAITRVLLVKTHGETLALPLADVVQVARVEPQAIEQMGGTPVVRLEQQMFPVVHLGDRLRLPQPVENNARLLPIVVVQTGDSQVAFVVDELLGGREVVVKTLGNHLRRIHGVIGSTLMGDGSVVLILNPLELSQQKPQAVTARKAVAKQVTRAREALEILIVDDSFSVRRVVANLIKSAGWHPTLAKDGLEALQIMQHATVPPDLILLDVEMPQMDGYELTSTLRAQAAYRSVPIVMLTSRSGEKHRQKAFEVGATEYLVKPYQDDMLLGTIRRLVPQVEGVHAA